MEQSDRYVKGADDFSIDFFESLKRLQILRAFWAYKGQQRTKSSVARN
jgi:hypothetical protein